MNIREAYNQWASSYDSIENKTRDLEARALKYHLANLQFDYILEAGCGTGKNTPFLASKATLLTAADFSEEMIARAIEKNSNPSVQFLQADFTRPWLFENGHFGLVSFSLVLEHINNLEFIFGEAQRVLKSGGYLYIGELHPFKQYSGSKARFDDGSGMLELECFVHHLSDYTNAAAQNGFTLQQLNEWFDEDNLTNPPRIISMLFKK